MIENTFGYLENGAAKYEGLADKYVDFTLKNQLLDSAVWENFVDLFKEDSDEDDGGWRCEYWGKLMRGACLVYRYTKSDELYSLLEKTVRDLLKTQREDGRFSTYGKAAQLHGWDVWGRKYVLTGLLHFYDICKDEALKETVLKALCRHVEALMEKVGDGDEKIKITKTSDFWLGVNSASILDGVLELYQKTGNENFLRFGEYIISTGGIEGGNLLDLAEKGEKMPFEYPETKAYETLSFFEGLLTYYEITGKSRYLKAVERFIEAVNETDITIIGCAGCTHELFDCSSVKQTEPAETVMQETCVTVTWMRISAKLHLLTGDEKYFDRLEKAAYNALYGSVNENLLRQYEVNGPLYGKPLPFDSYSPLYNGVRGHGIGGFKRLKDGSAYGCCVAIAAAGIALLPLFSTLKKKDGIVLNGLLSGSVRTKTPSKNALLLTTEAALTSALRFKATLSLEKAETFSLTLRVPPFATLPTLKINGKEEPVKVGYNEIKRLWKQGDTLTLSAELPLKEIKLNGKTAFTKGPLVLALDEEKGAPEEGLTAPLRLKRDGEKPVVTEEKPSPRYGESLRLYLEREAGKPPLLLTNYSSCGKRWDKENCKLSVWLNIEK